MLLRAPIWLIAVTCASFAARSSTQDAPDSGPACRECSKIGWIACEEHKRGETAWEDSVLFCSVLADCPECRGVGWIDCPECDNPATDARLEEKRALARALRGPLEVYDRDMGRPLRKAESDHFILIWEVDSLKVDKRRREGHELMHVYIDRLEHLYDEYCSVLSVEDDEFRVKSKVFVWWLVGEQREAALRFASQSGAGGVKLMGAEAVYSVCGNRQFFRNDELLHRNIVHSVTHLLLSHQSPSMWLGNINGGWAEEGLAHWFEERLFGLCDNYCYEEQNTVTTFKGGKYKVALRKLLEADEAPPVTSVLNLNTDQLSGPQHAVTFSLVDYLIGRDAKGFNQLCKRLRSKVIARDALAEVFGMSPLELQVQWKAWVLATYPTR
jgi:hypothetical protein